MDRASGIIMHISSLPGKYGIGTFGEHAYRFADFLGQAGQKYWQILPLGHTGYGDSPYQSFSAFAGNPYFIDFDKLIKDKLLRQEDIDELTFNNEKTSVNYGLLFQTRFKVLKIAYINSKGKLDEEIASFKNETASWIKDYALYMAIKEKMASKHWGKWDKEIKQRCPQAMEKYTQELKEEIDFWVFVQYEFFKQWRELKDYVNALGIQIIGDIPIYVAGDSADAWANPKLFQLDENSNPIVVAGCPPDAFSETGQLWGNPIYDWDALEKNEYKWWIDRIRASLILYDVIRIDHFRGFEAYWAIPGEEKTAVNGKWVKGPGIKLFDAIKKSLGDIDIIAEDLGFLTQAVLDFKAETGYPGMKVLQFAFGGEDSDYLPHNYQRECIVYTGTHDNDTIWGWIKQTGNPKEVKHAIEYLKLDDKERMNWGFIRGVWSSVGKVAMTQMQDLLGLGNDARMNYPSTLGGNWTWRMREGVLTDDLAEKLYAITKLYGRV